METLILPLLLLTNLGLVFALALSFQKYLKLKKISQREKKEERQKEEEILDEARKKSYEIVSIAYEKAGKVLSQTENVDKKLNEKLKKAYEDAFSITRGEVRDAIDREIGELKTSLEKETFAGEAEVKEKISQDYLKLEAELEAYKAKKFEEIEGIALKIAKDAVYKFLGNSISLEQHRDLIVKSLEEAKKANVF